MLRTKSFLIFVGAVIFLCASPFLVAPFTLVRALHQLERRLAEQAISAVQSAVEDELVELKRTAEDWAFWDATYQFIDDLNAAYIKENLNKESLITLHVKAILFYDVEGRLRYQAALDPETGNLENLFQKLLDRIQSTTSMFRAKDAQECRAGVLVHGDRAMFTAACPILTSEKKGPSRGILIMIQEVDEDFTRRLEQSAGHTVSLGTIPLEGTASAPREEPLSTVAFFPDHIAVRIVFPDLSGRAGFRVDTILERAIRQKGVRSFVAFALVLASVALVAIGFLWSFMDRRVLRRIHDLVVKVQHAPLPLEDTLGARSSDEIVVLDKSIEGLLDALETSLERDVEQRREIQQIFEQHPVGIILVDQERRTVSWANPKALELMGRSLEDVRHKPCKDVVCPLEDKTCPVLDQRREVRDGECLMPTRNGQGVPVLRSIVPVTYNQRPHLLEAVMDLRQQKALESQLAQAKKLETVGLVAGGVAHDLNNLLTSFVGYPDMLLRRLSASDPMYRSLTHIRHAGLKAGAIVQDLLTLARRGVRSMERIDLGAVIHGFLRSNEFAALRHTNVGVRFQTQIQSGSLYAFGSGLHLEKALANLLRNAVEAITGTGLVTIGLQTVDLKDAYAGFETVPPGRWIRLSVEDTGNGIAPEDLPHIFEPFYTRKKMGRSGTGLGMTIIWHTVKDMGGFVDVVSVPGNGTTFCLYLPEAESPAENTHPQLLETLPRGSGEKVLVVEDMEDQRVLVHALLSDLGYRVVTAASGSEALQLAVAQRFDLLILDMRLGEGMDGPEVYQEVLKHHPDQKALIVSGDVSTDRVAVAKALGITHFVSKPYTLEKLARAVHAVLHDLKLCE